MTDGNAGPVRIEYDLIGDKEIPADAYKFMRPGLVSTIAAVVSGLAIAKLLY